MGNTWKSSQYAKMKGTTEVGAGTECPMCGEPFNKKNTYNSVSYVTTNSSGVDIDLKPHGSQILVTNENKEEFIRLKCAYLAHE